MGTDGEAPGEQPGAFSPLTTKKASPRASEGSVRPLVAFRGLVYIIQQNGCQGLLAALRGFKPQYLTSLENLIISTWQS